MLNRVWNHASGYLTTLLTITCMTMVVGCEHEPETETSFSEPPAEVLQRYEQIYATAADGRDPFAVDPNEAFPVDFGLTALKQRQLQRSEDVATAIEDQFATQLWAALNADDDNPLSTLMADGFIGHTQLQSTRDSQLQMGSVSFQTWIQTPDPPGLSAEEFITELRQLLLSNARPDDCRLHVLAMSRVPDSAVEPALAADDVSALSPQPTGPQDSVAAGPVRWQCRIQLMLTNRGGDIPLQHQRSTHDVTLEWNSQQSGLSNQPLVSWSIASIAAQQFPHPVFGEVTADVGLQNTGIEDNWDLPFSKVRPHRFQMVVEDFDQDGWLDIAVAETHRSRLFRWVPERSAFLQVTEPSGIVTLHAARNTPVSLAGSFDFDNDGDPDLVLGNRLYENIGAGKFVDVTAQSGLSFQRGAVSVHFADYDCDGRTDMYVVYRSTGDNVSEHETPEAPLISHTGTRNQLWRNVGQGRFRDVTSTSNSAGSFGDSLAATWLYYDDDAFPDLMIVNAAGQNTLLRNTGNGAFEDISQSSGILQSAAGTGVAAADLDNDGQTDLYVASVYSRMAQRIAGQISSQDVPTEIDGQLQQSAAGNRLYRRTESRGEFQSSGDDLAIHDVGWSFAPVLADFDNDGRMDIYAASGYISFTDDAGPVRPYPWQSRVAPPLHTIHALTLRTATDSGPATVRMANPFLMTEPGKNLSTYEPNRLFMNIDGQSFVDASVGSMADITADSRSVVAADFNRDGKPDLLVGSVGGGPLRLFFNQLPTTVSGNRLRISLTGTTSNRRAIGARLEAWTGDQRIVRDVFCHNTGGGQSPAEVLLGLGSATSVDRLRVRWPGGEWQQFDEIPANSDVHLVEGIATAKIVAFPVDSSMPVNLGDDAE